MNYNQSFNETEEIGGLKFLLNNLGILLPYLTFLVLGTVFGVLGNLLIMAAVIFSKELRTTTKNAFIFNLAVSDLIISGIVDSFVAVGK